MKYIVTLNYTNFVFEDSAEAVTFAETAKKAYRAGRYTDKEMSVTIELVSDAEMEEKED